MEKAPYTYSQVRQFAAATQPQPRISLYYSNWKEPFQTSFADASYASNSVTMIQMLPTGVDLATIAEGGSDSYLRSYARAVRTFRHPVIIGFAPEMNGNWYKWGYQNTSPATWVAAWRHVVDVFRANGADNVSWLWTVNEIYQDSGPLNQYWPGKGYVTWLGIDAYFVPQKHSFNSVVVPTLRNVRRITSAPVIISETGIAPGAGKVATLQQLFSGVRAQHLLGFVYFDGNQPQGANYHYWWRLEDSPAAMAEYATLARQYEGDGQDAPNSADTVASKP